jgi:hypothetical protein
MSRVIFPPFQHKSGSTELDHAIDATALDGAFTELAQTLNGTIDESSFGASVAFSTASPGGVNVSTAIANGYALVTVSYNGIGRTNTRVPLITVTGTGWKPYLFSVVTIMAPLTVSALSIDVGASGTGTSLITSSSGTYEYGASMIATINGTLDTTALTQGHTVTLNENTAHTIAASVTFLVPVSA